MASLVDNILNIFSAKNQSDSVLGIDVGSSSIKVVQLKRKAGKAVLQTYGEIALGPYAATQIGRSTKLPPEKLSLALIDLLKESNTTTIDSALAVPMRSSMVSVFRMPELKDKQLAQMVPIEARKYIPVPISEVTLDWFVIPAIGDENYYDTENKKFIEVMNVAIHNDVLSDFSNLVGLTQINASFFEVEMFATARAILESGYLTPVMIVDIGAGTTKIYITERGVIRDSHIINRGSQDITLNISTSLNQSIDFSEKLKRNFGKNDANQDKEISNIIDLVMAPIFNEASRALMNFQKLHNKNVTKIMLIGGGALLNGVPERAQKSFGIETVIGNPFDKVETPAFLQSVLSTTGSMFSVAVGLALRKLQEQE